ncbi:hypothetical protein IMZ31_05165 [Pontibacillus sp. ALD_SL1]|uniref:McrB family protein n=1 Tax=Pontibacillus sp. ALD_SL1 TaxID=2777185 RepID=UPI001A96A496|nr:hypothetical protein [Pontibacillus sp. ALD_SL1]QST00963.1 hypothetical protein IMZ31_05165 [Pontibacillus sp. ALD_SL1]
MKLSTKLPHIVRRQLDDSIFVGRLATSSEIHTQTFQDSPVVLSEHSDRLTFYIKPLSPIPNGLTRYFGKMSDLLTGNTNSMNNVRLLNDLINYDRLPYPDIKPRVEALFQDKLVLFKLTHANDNIYVELIKLEPIQPEEGYVVIPSPDLRIGETNEDLESKLTNEKRPITLKKYPNLFPSPSMVLFENTLYEVDLESKSNSTTYFQKDHASVRYAALDPDELIEHVDAVYEHHLYFLSKQKFASLCELFETKKKGLAIQPQPEEEPPAAPVVSNEEHSPTPARATSEMEFLHRLLHKAGYEHKMFYREEDLYAFHMSVKTNPLTILGGMSGTGKSQLARIYGETLGLVEGETMLFLPISPSYQDPNDILGYLNPTTELFHESDTGLVSLLQHAAEYPDQLHMVIFDEMNLSQVEHWFSPFLSLLEINGDKHLQIFNDHVTEQSGRYESRIKLGDNLIFVGTVNFDETTKSFSDRLLDRTNIITPKKPPFKDTIAFYEKVHRSVPVSPEAKRVSASHLRREWRFAPQEVGLHLLNEYEVHTLDAIHTLMNENDPQKGVSFRVALAIADYLCNVPHDEHGLPLLSRRELFDFQINQRILTKIKGIDTFAGPMVGEMSTPIDYVDGSLAQLFKSDRAQMASDFTLSLKTLQNKAKELMMYGFTN